MATIEEFVLKNIGFWWRYGISRPIDLLPPYASLKTLNFALGACAIYRLWTYLRKVIPETSRAH
jgi:hypothetical protein